MTDFRPVLYRQVGQFAVGGIAVGVDVAGIQSGRDLQIDLEIKSRKMIKFSFVKGLIKISFAN